MEPSAAGKRRPKVLVVETGDTSHIPNEDPDFREVIDYRIYQHYPRWLRKIEEKLRLDVGLALAARKRAADFDVVFANSEKVGIPLSVVGLKKPLIVTFHSWKEPKRAIVKLLKLYRRWAAVGFVTDDQYETLRREFHIPDTNLFRALSVRLDKFYPGPEQPGAPIISLGAAKRDYPTLIEALRELPECAARIYASSKYGDTYGGGTGTLPGWVEFTGRVADEEVPGCYRASRFVVLPLEARAHSGAGVTVALEASASGKAIIATRTSGTPNFIKDGETGILVPPADAAALRSAIAYLWDHPSIACEMGQAGRRYMEEKFSFHKNILRIQQIMQRTMRD